MKNLNFLLALCFVILLSSCATDIDGIGDNNTPKEDKKKIVFTAEKAQVCPSSRATVQDDYSILWDEGDVIKVFDGINENTFTLVSGAGTACAQFEGEALEADRYVALYGWDGSTMKLDGNTLSAVSIPVSTNSTIGYKKHIMLAVSDANNNMLFKSGNSFVKITTLTSTKRITITGGENDVLGSYYNYTFDANGNIVNITPKYDPSTLNSLFKILATNYVTIYCDETSGTYLIPIAPTTLSRMEVVVEDASGSFLSRIISHEIHNFEAPGTVIDFGTVCEEEGWIKRLHHQEEICAHFYEAGQGKAQAEHVDLGLPSGLKWSSINLGATSPEGYGDYYAWGATIPWLESYDQDGNVSSITTFEATSAECPLGMCKWNSNYTSGYVTYKTPFIKKTTNAQTDPNSWSKYFPGLDDKTVLEPEDDAAVQQWGDGWRMPTDKEFNELASKCYWEWTENYNNTGIHGVIVYKAKQDADKGIFHNGSVWKKTVNGIDYVASSRPDSFAEYGISTDSYIFLPQPGLVDGRKTALSGEYGRYWSSTLSLLSVNSSYSNNARFLYFSSNGLYDQSPVGLGGNAGRVFGQPIRPVHP